MSWVLRVFSSVLVVSQMLISVRCLTNLEFFDLVKDYINDVELRDKTALQAINDDTSDVIELSGGPDDDVDLVYLLKRLGFTISEAKEEFDPYATYQEQSANKRGQGNCICGGVKCSCCSSQKFELNLWVAKYSFTLIGCVNVEYLVINKGFHASITINGYKVFDEEISLRNPPALCIGIPALKKVAGVCIQFYNVDYNNRRACIKIGGQVNLLIKKFRMDLILGCFSFPYMPLKRGAALEKHDNQADINDVDILLRHMFDLKSSGSNKNSKADTEESWSSEEDADQLSSQQNGDKARETDELQD